MTSHRKTSKLHPFAQFLIELLSVRAGLYVKQDSLKESRRV
ncbi:hypothetical protein [Acinetobacter thermotolerans]